MKLYAPAYYKRFQCIADRCEHSCCIGWEIDIDDASVKRYQALQGNYAAAIAASICMEETPHFRLGEQERCPHLNKQGLCEIILHFGEDALCDICREHPRFYNFTRVAEVGVGMSCMEAARLILSASDFAAFEAIGEVDAEPDEVAFDGRAKRDELYACLQDTADYTAALAEIYRTYSIDAGDDAQWLEILDSLEYLDAAHRDLFLHYSSARRPDYADEYLKRFLAYLVYRHCTEALDEEDFSVRLAFCLFCERLLAALICTESATTLPEIARLACIVSEEIEYSDENTFALMG